MPTYRFLDTERRDIVFEEGVTEFIYHPESGRLCLGKECSCAFLISVDGGAPQSCLFLPRNMRHDEIVRRIEEIAPKGVFFKEVRGGPDGLVCFKVANIAKK